MSIYEENITPIKIAHLAEYASQVKRISLDDALVYIYLNPMYERQYEEKAKWPCDDGYRREACSIGCRYVQGGDRIDECKPEREDPS